MSDFFKDFNKGFNTRPRTFLTERRTVCVKHKDGRITEHHGITKPWQYIKKVKKSMDVISAWIKED